MSGDHNMYASGGQPAFPAQFFDERATGMTMRDEFAKAALPAVIAHWAECNIDDQKREGDDTITGLQLYGNKGGSPLGIASDAYAIADAMMEARK